MCGSVTWSSTSSGRPSSRLVEQVGEQEIVQPLDLGDDALVRRVARHQPAEIGDVGKGDRDVLRRCHSSRRRLARRPDPVDPALGIGERGGDGVAAPETGAVLGLGRLAGLASHRAPMAALDKLLQALTGRAAFAM